MHSIRLTIRSADFNCDIKLNRRVTVIKGDSGVGKTVLSDIMSRRDKDIKIDCSLKWFVMPDYGWEHNMETMKNTLFIIDDRDFVESRLFATLFKSSIDNGNYFMIIDRSMPNGYNLKMLSYSSNEIYNFKNDGINHWIEQRYQYEDEEDGSSCIQTGSICFLIEDNKSGYEFFSRLVSVDCFPSTNGKSSLIKDIENLGKKYNTVFVLVDTASFGCHMEEFYSICTWIFKFQIIFMSDYECFEELLVKTNLLQNLGVVKKELSMIHKYANKEMSWEVYFESLLERATKDKLYNQSHGRKLNTCYYEDCDECNEIKSSKCGMSELLSGDKFIALLKGTKYERLLDYH